MNRQNFLKIVLKFCLRNQKLWINNKVLLYSTGNYIRYPVINHNRREYEKEYTYI